MSSLDFEDTNKEGHWSPQDTSDILCTGSRRNSILKQDIFTFSVLLFTNIDINFSTKTVSLLSRQYLILKAVENIEQVIYVSLFWFQFLVCVWCLWFISTLIFNAFLMNFCFHNLTISSLAHKNWIYKNIYKIIKVSSHGHKKIHIL